MSMREARSLHELKEEIVSLRKSNLMKDDTIAFLQKEKESLLKEVRHYEVVCAGVQSDAALQHKYEQEVKQLRADLQHWRDAVRRQKQIRKNSLETEQQHKALIDDIQRNSNNILSGIQSETSNSLRRQLDDIITYQDHETCWKLLRVCNGTLAEAYGQLTKYKLVSVEASRRRRRHRSSFNVWCGIYCSLMEATAPSKPVMRYSHSLIDNANSGIPHSQPLRSDMARIARQSLSNAANNASALSAYNSRALLQAERRSQTVNTGQGIAGGKY